ncbi:UDP-N-acetylmuramoyl-tripeptide--D-alanyl-D-alanine ligase [Ornithinibacillus salinisoli]|uniref:UDP-N-acetylmuramoyl-tripeptide--D-alanyl-D-alanine ligase n=1 Tax=Ornithinibacillus salinisoli TaxID=1848459 RepID=A0ABW4W0Y9_9BACI
MIHRRLIDIQDMVSGSGLLSSNENQLIEGVSIDSRTVKQGNLFIPIIRLKDGHLYVREAIKNGAVATLWLKNHPNPPTDIPVIFVDDTLVALQSLAKNYRKQLSVKVIGITGSNGKTTTKDMVSSIAKTTFTVHKTKGNLNSEYGLPLTVLEVSEKDDIVVLEMGMSQRGEIEMLSTIAQPNIAIITMIGVSHIANLGSKEEIANAKLEIITGLQEKGTFIYNGDEPLLQKINDRFHKKQLRTLTFGEQSSSNDFYPTKIEMNSGFMQFCINHNDSPVFTMNIIGKHNVYNALAAIAVGKELGIPMKTIANGLQKVKLTDMRMQKIMGANGLTIINDAWNASPHSVRMAIETFQELVGYRNKILVLGDMLELGEKEVDYHKEIGQRISPNKIDYLFTYGNLSKHIAMEAQKYFERNRVFSYTNKNALIENLTRTVESQDIVLVKGSRGMRLEDVVNILL